MQWKQSQTQGRTPDWPQARRSRFEEFIAFEFTGEDTHGLIGPKPLRHVHEQTKVAGIERLIRVCSRGGVRAPVRLIVEYT